jgi:hypothetical protein
MAIVSNKHNNTMSFAADPHDLRSRQITPPIAKVEPESPRASMPKMMRPSQMREEEQAQDEQGHEEIILSDHDALLLLLTLSIFMIPFRAEDCCDGRNPHA